MTRPKFLAFLCVVAAIVSRIQPGVSSQAPPPRRPPAELRRLSIAAETPGLAAPFKGITTNGQIERGLFGIRSTGVSTRPVREAAETFLAGLTQAQRDKSLFAVDDPEWRKWMNQSFYVRQGVSFLEMSSEQRDKAFGLLRASLSARGVRQTRDIMRLNETLGELAGNNFDEYGEWQYHITVMGRPSATEPWGWQFDGHHAIINYFVLGDQVVMTPFFAGSEPVVAASGKYKGTSVLQDEQNRGLALINALTDAQRRKAIVRFSKTGNDNLTEAWTDNVVLDYAGVPAKELAAPQRQQLLDLVALYVDNMDDGHARVKMDEVRAFLDRTWLAWIGDTRPGSAFYYRIHSPVILIEFDHQRPVALRHLMNPDVPNVAHIHTVVRTPNGNDYGKDLLRQHYEQHPHPAQASAREQVTAAERAFARTMAERDLTAFTEFLSDEAIFFTGQSPLRGKKAVTDGWGPYFTGKTAPFSWEPDQVEVLESGTLALSTGPVRDPSQTIIGRFNSIWRLEAPNVWRIIFDKGSPASPGPQP